jgi:hypothetical protein
MGAEPLALSNLTDAELSAGSPSSCLGKNNGSAKAGFNTTSSQHLRQIGAGQVAIYIGVQIKEEAAVAAAS